MQLRAVSPGSCPEQHQSSAILYITELLHWSQQRECPAQGHTASKCWEKAECLHIHFTCPEFPSWSEKFEIAAFWSQAISLIFRPPTPLAEWINYVSWMSNGMYPLKNTFSMSVLRFFFCNEGLTVTNLPYFPTQNVPKSMCYNKNIISKHSQKRWTTNQQVFQGTYLKCMPNCAVHELNKMSIEARCCVSLPIYTALQIHQWIWKTLNH